MCSGWFKDIVGVESRLRAGQLRNCGTVPSTDKRFFSTPNQEPPREEVSRAGPRAEHSSRTGA